MNESSAPYRRILTTRADRWLWGCWAIVALPILWWLVQVLSVNWIPSGDAAVAAVKIHDVFTHDLPLLGMPSTSSTYVEGNTAHHPGPLQFYLLAAGYRLTGGWPGSLLIGSVVIMLVLVWMSLRAGRTAGGMHGLILILVALVLNFMSMGLYSVIPWNPWPASVAAIAAFATAWAVLQGHHQWWLGFIFASALAAQSHLSFGPLMIVLGLVLVAVTLIDVRRRGVLRSDIGHWINGFAALLLLWAPPIIDQLMRDPGNLTKILEFSGASGGGVSWIVYAIGLAAVLGLLAWRGVSLTSGGRSTLIPLLVIGWAVWHWSVARSAEGTGASYAYTAGLLVLAGCITFPALWVIRRMPDRRIFAAGMVAALVVAATFDSWNFVRDFDSERSDAGIASAVVAISTQEVGQADSNLPIEIRTSGSHAWANLGAAVCAEFVRDGLDVHCGDVWTMGREGDRRHPRHLTGPRLVVLVTTGAGEPTDAADVVRFAQVDDRLGVTVERDEAWATVSVFEDDPEAAGEEILGG